MSSLWPCNGDEIGTAAEGWVVCALWPCNGDEIGTEAELCPLSGHAMVMR